MEVVGPYALPYRDRERRRAANEPPIGAGLRRRRSRRIYFNWRKVSIYGGSNEIQKNIIAKAILGL